MATSKASTPAEPDEFDKLLSRVGAPEGEKSFEDEFAGVDDLLDTVEEDDSEGWVPKEKGEGIVGIVRKRGETRSDFAKPGEDPMVPNVTIECRDPDNPGKTIKYRVIGYGSVLNREITDQDPQPGDIMAVKYWGEKPLKTGPFAGRNFKHFGIAVTKR